jgi:glycosyltransferase involved in cell wall biosynthesis
MKVLYIGNYNDGTGWGNAAKANITALSMIEGVEVYPRSITFNGSYETKDETISLIEQKNGALVGTPDVCIQHTLPHLYAYDSRYKNIGVFYFEANSVPVEWIGQLNMMDELWVATFKNKEDAIKSGVTTPIKIVPIPLDTDKIIHLGRSGSLRIDRMQNKFNFGFVGEFVERKNLKALLRAFHAEFDPSEPVNLLIKTSGSTIEKLREYVNQVKAGLKIRNNYIEEIIVCGIMEEKDYYNLLNDLSCLVVPSRAEGWCIPAWEAMALQVPVISAEGTGITPHENELMKLVPSRVEPCFGALDTINFLQTADQTWNEIDVNELRKAMRKMCSTQPEKTDSSWHSLLSFKSVGSAMVSNIKNLLKGKNV